MDAETRVYDPTPTLERFHASNALYRGLLGPVGSGKSSGCCIEIITRAGEQKPDKDGLRRTRFAVVRNTYRELSDTTVKTWLFWVDEGQFGPFNHTGMEHHICFDLEDGTTVDCEVLFRALDKPQDIKKLLSLELTGAWVNEAKEVPLTLVEALGDRVERYPANCSWCGVFMDTNPPDSDHWWYRLAEEDRPEGWEFFRQPGGLIEVDGKFLPNPSAENLRVLDEDGNILVHGIPRDYYTKRMSGKAPAHIRVYYCAQYGFVQDGKPVYPEYVDKLHALEEEPNVLPGLIYVGIDFGLTPAAVLGQRKTSGGWQWINELVTQDMGQVRFAELLKGMVQGEYQNHTFEFFGDPAGVQRAQTDERTPFDILKAAGIPARPAPTNDFTIRRESVAAACGRIIDGVPGLQISPRCVNLRKGMAGAYQYKRLQVSGDERYQDVPDKGKFSHVCEAAQYLMVGAGEGKQLIRRPTLPKPTHTYVSRRLV
jgi:hypothetical protein